MAGRGSYLLQLVLVLQAVALGSSQPSTFCASTLTRLTCPPDLPTFDQVELQKYAGRWYEIGANAYFKNLQESGGTCVSAFYTPTDEGSIEVFNSQTRVIGDLGVSLVRGIALQAAEICQGARQICTEIHTETNSQGLITLQEVANNISLTHPHESSLLLQSKSTIEKAVMGIDLGLDSLSKGVSQIQVLNSKLSQADGKARDLVAELSDIAGKINSDIVDTTIAINLAAIAGARNNITTVAGKLYHSGSTKQISQQLFQVVSLIQGVEGSIPGHAATIKATVAGAADSAASFAYEKNEGVGGFFSISGKAVVPNATAPGKLLVSFAASPAPPAKYWILKVDDETSEDYGAAIVYGCSDVPGGGTYQPLFFLSREPTLSDDVSIAFSDYVRSLGIHPNCHEVFVPTRQPDTCQYASPPPSYGR